MKKSVLVVLLLILSLFIVSFPQIVIVNAQSNTIYIRADGIVEGTDKIHRDGDVFTLIGNISGRINVERNFTIIDGEGFTLKGNGEGTGIDLRFTDGPLITNVTIKNLQITNFEYGIFSSTNNTFIGNYISDCFCGINILGGSNSLILNNTLINNGNPISIAYSGGNHTITQNNIINGTTIIVWLSAQPNVFMNYWSDYNGTDTNGDGIGDTPYVYINADYAKLSDNYPLIEPVPTIPEFPSWTPLLISGLIAVFLMSIIYRQRIKER